MKRSPSSACPSSTRYSATILALFLLVRYWRASTLNDLKRMRSELRRVGSEQRQLSRAFPDLFPARSASYGERAALLNDQLNAAASKSTRCNTAGCHARDKSAAFTA